jgi:hypothetical protein
MGDKWQPNKPLPPHGLGRIVNRTIFPPSTLLSPGPRRRTINNTPVLLSWAAFTMAGIAASVLVGLAMLLTDPNLSNTSPFWTPLAAAGDSLRISSIVAMGNRFLYASSLPADSSDNVDDVDEEEEDEDVDVPVDGFVDPVSGIAAYSSGNKFSIRFISSLWSAFHATQAQQEKYEIVN